VELEGEIGEIPILERVVDAVPYTQFQNFRGPYAYKRKGGEIQLETQLRPNDFFEGNQLSCFAGHVDVEKALMISPVDDLLACNPELRDFYEQHANRVLAATGGRGSINDMALYETVFQRTGGGVMDFAGLRPIEIYEEALQWLSEYRAIQWWSWFRICGVTGFMLSHHGNDVAAREQIWKAHHTWSSQYPYFTVEENVRMVEKACRRSRLPGLPFLLNLVRFDNPDMSIREHAFRTFSPRPNGGKGHNE